MLGITSVGGYERGKIVALFILMTSCAAQLNDYGISVSPRPPPHAKLVQPDFESIRQEILEPLCVDCHSGPQAPHKIDLTSYDSIMKNNLFPPLIVPKKPEASSLYQAIASGSMPKNRPALSAQELEAVRQWILSGAQPNEGSGDDDDHGGEPPDDHSPEIFQ